MKHEVFFWMEWWKEHIVLKLRHVGHICWVSLSLSSLAQRPTSLLEWFPRYPEKSISLQWPGIPAAVQLPWVFFFLTGKSRYNVCKESLNLPQRLMDTKVRSVSLWRLSLLLLVYYCWSICSVWCLVMTSLFPDATGDTGRGEHYTDPEFKRRTLHLQRRTAVSL